jgi:hypothetical protein
MAKKPTILSTWQGRPIYDQDHHHELEQTAAIKQYGEGMSREEAEDFAYRNYRNEHLRRIAAHHYAGMKAAQAVGDLQSLYQHKVGYGEALKLLGHNPDGPVPPDVAMYVHPDYHNVYKYKAHPADDLVLSGWEHSPKKLVPEIQKSESVQDILARVKAILQG